MKTKSTITLVAVVFCIVLLSSIPGYAVENGGVKAASSMETDISAIYRNVELNESNSLKNAFSDNVMAFLDSKKEVTQYIQEINHIRDKDEYSVSATLISKKIEDTYTTFLYNVETAYRYEGSNIQSGEGFLVMIKVDSASNTIIEFYELQDAFDQFVRDETGLSLDPVIISAQMRRDIESLDGGLIKAKANAYMNAVLNQKNELEALNQVFQTEGVENTESRAASAYLSVASMKTWALNNCTKTSPSSGGSGVSYYDFSQISGNYDCTNFISHALLAGGATPYKPSGNSGIVSTGWYYNGLNDRSSSWTGVSFLYDFLTTNSTRGPAGITSVFSSNPATHSVGDILQFKSGSTWMHSTIITGYSEDSTESSAYPLVTGRTSPGVYQKNKDAREVYAGNQRRIIRNLRNIS